MPDIPKPTHLLLRDIKSFWVVDGLAHEGVDKVPVFILKSFD